MTSWSGFWGDTANTTGSYTPINNKTPLRHQLRKLFRRRGLRELGEAIDMIATDATPASTLSVTRSQVQATALAGVIGGGGAVTIESKEQVGKLNSVPSDTGANTSRAIAAADVTDARKIVVGGSESSSAPSTYATDASGNGGGGKLSGIAY
jgi:hypothetical protein